jgi:polyhydroxyalkanoate synthesis regulator phasin
MPDKTPAVAKPVAADATAAAVTTPPVRRHPGHRGADVRDTVAEMAAKAQEISMEAGSKMAAAMKDVINAAAGLTSFAIESSRDLVQYMVRRGQMTQDEADKLIREAEDSWSKKHRGRKPPARGPASQPAAKSSAKPAAGAAAPRKLEVSKPAPRRPARKKPASKAIRKSAKKTPASNKAKKKPASKK